MSNPVVSDKMRYGLKPIAVESKAHLLTVPCVGTNLYSGDTSSTIIFRIQHNPSGRYIDPIETKFKMTLQFQFPDFLNVSDTFFLERGPESIIRRVHHKRHSRSCVRGYRSVQHAIRYHRNLHW